MNKQLLGVTLAILTGAVFGLPSAIANESNISTKNIEYTKTFKNKKAIKVIKKLARSMGGIKRIKRIDNQVIESHIQRFAPEQTFKPGDTGLLTSNIHRILTRDLNTFQSFSDWNFDNFYPTFSQFIFSEIINGDHGAILGEDGLFSPPRAPMRSTRIGTRQQQYFMSSPLSLVQWALNHRKQLVYLGKNKINGHNFHVVRMPGQAEQPITLYIDTKRNLLRKASILEDDTIYGDAKWEIHFKHWKKNHHVRLPYLVLHHLNTRQVAKEVRLSIVLNAETGNSLFNIPEDLISPFNQRQFDWGQRSSQWFTRLLSLGVPFDIDQSVPELVNFNEVGNNIFHILGATHNSLLIEMSDYLVIVDPVLYDDRTQEIISQIQQRWPTKPIRYVIASHFHNDHIGGIRGYAEVGAMIVVGEDTVEHYKAIFAAPHTVYPDALSQNPQEVNIIGVEDDEPFTISDGQRNIQIYDIANRHATGMLMPYIEDAKMIFTSDLYNPASAFGSPPPARFDQWAVDLLNALEELDLDIEHTAGAHGSTSSYQTFIDEITPLRR